LTPPSDEPCTTGGEMGVSRVEIDTSLERVEDGTPTRRHPFVAIPGSAWCERDGLKSDDTLPLSGRTPRIGPELGSAEPSGDDLSDAPRSRAPSLKGASGPSTERSTPIAPRTAC